MKLCADRKEKFTNLIIISLISVSFVLPFFLSKGVINGNNHEDWAFQFGRIRSIISALTNGSVPLGVNFLDFSSQGLAVNSLYPYFSLYFFIWPFLLPVRLKISVFVFAFLITFVTAGSMWKLSCSFTDKRWVKISAVLLYLFNNYHLLLMYKRFALGEILGYAFLPLAIAGLLDIWHNKQYGYITLALGMSLILNSHILSAMLTIILLVILEAFHVLVNHVKFDELKRIAQAAGLTIVLIGPSIYNFIKVSFSNKFETPSTVFSLNTFALHPTMYIRDIRNIFLPQALSNYTYQDWNLGIVIVILSAISVIYLIRKYSRQYLDGIFFGILGFLLLLTTTTLFKWNFTENYRAFSFLKMIQFPSRILLLATPMLIAPIAMMMDRLNIVITRVVVCMSILLLTVSGMFAIKKTANKLNVQLPPDIIESGINNQVITNDYFPKANLNKKNLTASVQVSHSYIPGPITFGWSSPTYRSANYQLQIRDNRLPEYVTTPVVGYQGLDYLVEVNNHPVNWKLSKDYGTLMIPTGHLKKNKKNTLSVSTTPYRFSFLFTVLCLGLYVFLFIKIIKR